MEHHKHVTTWLLAGFAVILLLMGMALFAQRPDLVKTLPMYAPSPTPTPVSSGAITVTSPHVDGHVGQTFTVTGKARVESNVVSLRLIDKFSGSVISETQAVTTASRPGETGDFSAQLGITDPSVRSESPILLEVFQVDPKTRKEIDKIILPITFSPTGE